MAGNAGTKFTSFDPVAEPATVQIRILPMRYLRIQDSVYAPEKGVEVGGDGKSRLVWKFHNAEVWVPERIANRVTLSNERSKEGLINPIAQVIKTRTVEDALAKAGVEVPPIEETSPSRRPAQGTTGAV